MAKTPMLCPFSERLCEECETYRGRHYYLCMCEKYRGYIKPKEPVNYDGHVKTYSFETLKRLFEPWYAAESKPQQEFKLKLKVIDMETGESRRCEPEEAKGWKWDDPIIMRVVNGGQVISWENLEDIIRYQETKGTKEIAVYEAPRFMLLGGG